MLSRGKVFAGAMSVAVVGWSSALAEAGHGPGCSTCRSGGYAAAHSHAYAPSFPQGYAPGFAPGYGQPYGPQPNGPQPYGPQMAPVPMHVMHGQPMTIVQQIPGEPPEPTPKWARPPGTVPVIALQEPQPRWVHPGALAATAAPGHPPLEATGHAASSAGAYPALTQSAGIPFAAQGVPFGVPVQMLPVNNGLNSGMLLAQNGPPASAPGSTQPVQVSPRNSGAVDPNSNIGSGNAAGSSGNVPGASLGSGAPSSNPAPYVPPGPNSGLQPQLAPQPDPLGAQGQPFGAQGQPFAGQYGQDPSILGSIPAYQPQAPMFQPPAMPQPAYQLAPSAPVRAMPVDRYQPFSDPPGPPPGTLGKTYQRPSRLIAWDKHPRIGMLDVEVLDSVRAGLADDVLIKVITQDIYNNNKPLEGFIGEDDVWHFESDPLLPSVPHIYDVRFELVRERTIQEMRHGRLFLRTKEEKLGTIGIRRIRLIPGRIVDLVLY